MLKAAVGVDPLIDVTLAVATFSTFKNIVLNGNGTNNATAMRFSGGRVTDVHLEKIFFYNAKIGLSITPSDTAFLYWIQDCNFEYCQDGVSISPNGHAIYDLFFEHCVWGNNTRYDYNLVNAGGLCYRVHFIHCSFGGTGSHSLNIADGRSHVIDSCTFYLVTGTAIRFTSNAQLNRVHNNYFQSCGVGISLIIRARILL